MPIHLRPDELPAETEEQAGSVDEDSADLIRGLLVAGRVCAVWLLIAAVAMIVAINSMQKVFIAADRVLRSGPGRHWADVWMPAFLFAIAGAAFGALLSWRVSSHSSLGDLTMCLAAGAVSVVLFAIGAMAAGAVFGGHVPTTCWVAMVVLAISIVGGAYALMHWTG